MLPLTAAAPLKAGELAEAEAEAVLLARGVEEAAPLELAPAPELELAVAEPAAEEDPEALELPLAVAVAVALALVSAGAELEVVSLAEAEALLEAEVVSMGGTTMGWPAEEHCSTTALETARVG